ncbi:hypothetical protein Tco_0066192 [Tanacetum coccineum]
MDYQCTQPSEIEICQQAEEIERNRLHEETMQMLREMIKIQEEKRVNEEAARQEEEKRIAEEKEAAEQEAKRKTQEYFNIEENSTRARRFRIDPTLSNFNLTTKHSLCPSSSKDNVGSINVIQERKTIVPKESLECFKIKEPPRFFYDAEFDNGEEIIPLMVISQDSIHPQKIIDKSLSDLMISYMNGNVTPPSFTSSPVIPIMNTVNSLSMGDKHLDTTKDSLESSVIDPIPIPSESNDTSDGVIDVPTAITPDLPNTDSLIMEDEHLDTISVTESANTIKSSVEDLVPTPSESVDLSVGEIECDMQISDDSPESHSTSFSNPLFDSNYDFSSSNDESILEKDVHEENFKTYSNTLFEVDEEIITIEVSKSIPPGIDNFNAESDLVESMLNQDTLIDSKIDFLLEEFASELAHSDPIPPGIDEANFDPEGDINLLEKLLYDNSSSHPPEDFSEPIIESLSPSPTPVEGSDSLMEEIDIFLASDDSMPPGIENDDDDSEGDIRYLEELLSNDSTSLPENESSNLDHVNDPSPPLPPPEPPDVEVCFDDQPNTGILLTKVVKGNSEHYVRLPQVLPTLPILAPDLDFTPSHDSFGSRNKFFDPGIFIEVQTVKPFLSHRAKITSDFSESPMMILGDNTPLLGVRQPHFYPP